MKPSPTKRRGRARERQEGWDERLVVRLAFILAGIAAAAAAYGTVTWAAG